MARNILTQVLIQLLTRLQNLLIALDQFLFCVLTLGAAYPDETASSAAWRSELQGKWQGRFFRPVIDWLFWLVQKDHCRKAYESEALGLQLPQEQRYGYQPPTKPR